VGNAVQHRAKSYTSHAELVPDRDPRFDRVQAHYLHRKGKLPAAAMPCRIPLTSFDCHRKA